MLHKVYKHLKKLEASGIRHQAHDLSEHRLKRPCMSIDACSSTLFPRDKCLFCHRLRKKKKGKGDILSRCETLAASETIKEKALSEPDYAIQAKVNDLDLVARQAHYHRSCHRLFTHEDERNLTQSRGEGDARDKNMAYDATFEYLSGYINESVIKNSNVERLGMLKEKYLIFIQEN